MKLESINDASYKKLSSDQMKLVIGGLATKEYYTIKIKTFWKGVRIDTNRDQGIRSDEDPVLGE